MTTDRDQPSAGGDRAAARDAAPATDATARARDDHELIAAALAGDGDAVRALVERHQPFVYNVAFKMFGRREDAEDLSQEVFVKVITQLATFRQQSAFRTWLYRITVNHFLKAKRTGLELTTDGFEPYFEAIDRMPSEEPARELLGPDDETVDELRLRCTTGMLMCLEREQRVTYILGAMFGISHRLGAEILDITPANFRVRLHRARRDLHSWMHRRCGLVEPANPCRCAKKTAGYVRLGLVDPKRLVFRGDYQRQVSELMADRAAEALEAVDELYDRWFRDHPAQLPTADLAAALLGERAIREVFAV